jgi:hypothetical protein
MAFKLTPKDLVDIRESAEVIGTPRWSTSLSLNDGRLQLDFDHVLVDLGDWATKVTKSQDRVR